ncbi:MAG: hypothetical protein AB7S39_01235 [Gemmatimonadales bacterium]
MTAGDGQEAAPGTAVATPPVVVVRSAAGAVVPNVTVSFAVDSGGGSIAASSAPTNASGAATPGAWTLGPTEGPQVLVVTVAGLQPVRIRAFARIPTTQVGFGTITGAGGSITVNQPGSPLNGAALTIPAGALSGPTPVTLSIVSSVGVTLEGGATVLAPGLVITTSGPVLSEPARIRIPTAAAPGDNTMLVAYNQRTGKATPLPRQVADAGAISAVLTSLDASVVPAAAPTFAGSLRGPTASGLGASELFQTAAAADDPLTLLVVQLPSDALTKPYPPSFLIKRDFWDFTNFAVAWLPFLNPEPPTANTVFDMAGGMVATALWYFDRRESTPLYGRFRIQPDQPASNRSGIRWAALASRQVAVYAVYSMRGADDLRDESAQRFHWDGLRAVKALMYFLRQPVPLVLNEVATLDELEQQPEPGTVHFAIAIGVVDDEIEIIVPENSDFTYKLKVTQAGGLTPATITNLAGEQFVVRSFVALNARQMLEQPGVADNWPNVLAETVGDAEGWPSPELHWKNGKLDKQNVVLADPLQHFWECAACPDFGISVPGAPTTATRPQPFQMGRIVGGAMATLPTGIVRSAATWSADSVDSETGPTRAGHAIYLAQEAIGSQYLLGWLDWQTVSYRRIGLHPAPAALTFSKDTTATFTLAPSQPLPAGATFSWVLRTDAGRDSVATTTPTHTRDLTAGQTGKLLITAYEKDTHRPIARDSMTIEFEGGFPYWRITSIVDEDELLDPGEAVPFQVLLARLLAVPQSGLIAVDDEGGGKKVLRLRVLPAGTWDPTECCPPPAAPGELRQSLGEQPTVTYQVGPFFAGFGTTEWSQSTSDLGAGTLFGQYVAGGTESRKIKDAGVQVGPVDFIRISATRNGSTMTGTMTVFAWFQDEETGEVDPEFEPTSYVLRFTAVRLK